MAGHGWQVALEGAISKRAAQTSLAQGNLPQARALRLPPTLPDAAGWQAPVQTPLAAPALGCTRMPQRSGPARAVRCRRRPR